MGGVESLRRRSEGLCCSSGILGPLEVTERGAPLLLGGAKQRAVLAILLLHGGQAISSERLINELWGERPPATAAKTLQGYVFHLRRALGDGVVAHPAGGYELELAPGQLDADEFERLAAEGRAGAEPAEIPRPPPASCARRSRCGAARRSPTSPTSRSRRPRSPAWRSCGWRRWRSASTPISRSAARTELVGELEALIAEHPAARAVRGQLMLALYRSARQAEALHAYQRRAARALRRARARAGRGAAAARAGDPRSQDPALDPARQQAPRGGLGADRPVLVFAARSTAWRRCSPRGAAGGLDAAARADRRVRRRRRPSSARRRPRSRARRRARVRRRRGTDRGVLLARRRAPTSRGSPARQGVDLLLAMPAAHRWRARPGRSSSRRRATWRCSSRRAARCGRAGARPVRRRRATTGRRSSSARGSRAPPARRCG